MDLIQLLIMVVIVCAIIAVIQIILPRTGMPSWVRSILYIVLAVVVLVWLLRLLGGVAIDL